jgi:hypothetical protein
MGSDPGTDRTTNRALTGDVVPHFCATCGRAGCVAAVQKRLREAEAELREALGVIARYRDQASRKASKGGKARASNLSASARSEIARNAAKTRWDRARGVLEKGDTPA